MFKSLRQGMPLYVFTKGVEPQLEICEVISRTEPVALQANPIVNFVNGQQVFTPPKMVVDVQVRSSKGDIINYQKLPADMEIADFGTNGTVISSSSDAIQYEVDTLRKQSLRVLESVDLHKKIVGTCDKLLSDLNPQIKQEVTRSKEIDSLKTEVKDLRSDLVDIKGMLTKALNIRKPKEE